MDISEWFSLSYSSYLVLPRVFLESMPENFQERFVALLQELEESLEIDENYTGQYKVQYWKDKRFAVDPYRAYRHTSVKLKEKEENGIEEQN